MGPQDSASSLVLDPPPIVTSASKPRGASLESLARMLVPPMVMPSLSPCALMSFKDTTTFEDEPCTHLLDLNCEMPISAHAPTKLGAVRQMGGSQSHSRPDSRLVEL